MGGRRGVAALCVVGALVGCGNPAQATPCEQLAELATLDGAASLTEDAGHTVSMLTRIEPVMPASHVDDVRTVRDGIAHVLDLAARHGAADLTELPASTRLEAANTLRSIAASAARIEDYRLDHCG